MATALPQPAGAGPRATAPPSPDELVVLLDERGRPSGTAPKAAAHHADTPFHLAFSCYAVDDAGRVLLTRRAATKATFPALWTNACCGHPAPGETLREAVTRRLRQELGLRPVRMGLAVPDFTYRAELGGIVEHELCPVVIAEVAGHPSPDPDEVDDLEWVGWDVLCRRVRHHPGSLSPWSVRQVARLAELGTAPKGWLDAEVPAGPGGDGDSDGHDGHELGAVALGAVGLDTPPAGGSRPATVPAAPATGGGPLDPVREVVDEVLAAFMDERQREAEAVGDAAAALAAQVRQLVAAGGKRLRPAFTYWGHRATGAAHDDRVLPVAAAVELLHTFCLVHDDVMDRSPQRRGLPTAHVALARHHERTGLEGDGAWFGVSAALLAGDMAFVWADQLLEAAGLPDDVMARARRVFTTLRTEVVGGQALDLQLAHAPDAGEPAARRVALLKSARYTVTRPLQLGAVLAHHPLGSGAAGTPHPAVGRMLATYGDAVGLAFQLRDDILGLYGDPATTGKSRLDDLREGKHTVLVLRALDLATDDDRAVLAQALGDPGLDEATAARCRRVVARSGALASVEALIEWQLAVARRAIAPLVEPARGALDELADLAARRDA
jgi:geranylgeranyl diphosphate synthase type I